jgi:GMP synthase-like glutamine amidotransferase
MADSLPIIRVACLVVDNPVPGSPEDLAYGPFHFGTSQENRDCFSCFPADVSFSTVSRPSIDLIRINYRDNIGFEFKRWLGHCSHVKVDFTNFNTIKGEFPELPKDHFASTAPLETQPFNLYIITGSHNGAYEDIQWIRDLEAWIRRADEAKAPLLGICFGHQVIATALGGVVTINPKGWEVGAHTFHLNSSGQPIFKGKNGLHLLYTHQDAVVRVPDSMINLGGNEKTDCQAMCKNSHIITLQGHPEFEQNTLEALLKKKLENGILSESAYQVAHRSLEDNIDSNYVACACMAYLKIHPELDE